MADPLSISSGIGLGSAQVFRPELSPTAGLKYAISEKRRKEALGMAQQKAKAKQKSDALATIEDVELGGWVGNLPELEKNKEFLINTLADKYVKNPEYDPNSREMRLAVSNLKKDVLTNKKKEDWLKGLSQFRKTADNFDKWDEVNTVQKMTLPESEKYLAEHGDFPYPTAKPELIDYNKLIADDAKSVLAESGTSIERITPEGTKTTSVTRYDPAKFDGWADATYTAGLKGIRPDVVKLIQDKKVELEGNTIYQGMTPEKQEEKLKYETVNAIKKIGKLTEKTSYGEALQGEGQGATFNFGDNSYENPEVRVVVSDTPEKTTYNIAEIKQGENPVYDFSLPDGKIVKGKPLRIERSKSTGGKDVVISYPETTRVNQGSTAKPQWVNKPTGNNIEKKVSYEVNKDRIFKGKLKFTIDEIDAGLTEKGVEVKKGTTKEPKVLSGKINPAQLTKGESYSVGGKLYIWNGTKLTPK